MELKTGYGSRVTVTGGRDVVVGGAVLKIESGKKTDLQFHLYTTKVYYTLEGTLKVNVMRDGVLRPVEAKAGAAFAVNKGLVYQLEAVGGDATVIEYTSRPENYLVEEGKMTEDVTVIARGTLPEPSPKPGEFATMTKEDEQKVEEPKEEPTKKTSRKKRTSKNKTTRKSTKS